IDQQEVKQCTESHEKRKPFILNTYRFPQVGRCLRRSPPGKIDDSHHRSLPDLHLARWLAYRDRYSLYRYKPCIRTSTYVNRCKGHPRQVELGWIDLLYSRRACDTQYC
ncbi:hypothetical protein CSUI_005516, partial [Cystoisospora suis]